MSCMKNVNRFVIPNDVIADLVEIYKYIGKSESYYKITASDMERIVSQTIERDTFFLAKLLNLEITDNRLRLIISKNSQPRNREEKILYSLKEILTNFLQYPSRQGLTSQALFNLQNYIYPKMGIKFDTYKDDKKNNPAYSGKQKRELLDELTESYEKCLKEGSVEKIILLINYLIDLSALKPFTEYNEALPYLVLYLLLSKSNYNAITYVSIFEKIYYQKSEFDDELANATANWTLGYHQILPFIQYIIKMLKEMYVHCETIVKSYEDDSTLNKGDNIENTINELPNIFTKDDIRLVHPYVSESTINRALKKLHDENIIRPLGRGRSAKWLKVGIR